ncbi:MAG: undecaprenyl/decaprenyl-phosphate alpha-N-acetylglucosaminyl 1-phosphate transferase [Planctomycetes bacterium]|nr:undecaprenyl/decaprenyl-phosphate alpha-N-acetylglucosaminyl 1-phosphate transferase [Planctomycetota bacterium]
MSSTPWISGLGADLLVCALAACAAGAASAFATPLARGLARRWNAVDQPGGRHVHRHATPRLGGLAVLLGLWAGATVAMPGVDATDGGPQPSVAWPILVLATLTCALGAWDDVRSLRPGQKLAGMAILGLGLAAAGVRIEVITLPGLGALALGAASIPATVIWVLVCANAVNLIDGVDGAGAGVVTVSGAVMALFVLGLGDPVSAVLFAAASGSAAGFLWHNREPATIFLGDSGSLLLGFTLAATSASGCAKGAAALTVGGAALALAVPLLDTGQSFLRRFLAALRGGRWQSALRATCVADLGHIHHRLLFRGMSHRRVSWTLCAATSVTALTALLLLLPPSEPVPRWAKFVTCATGAFVLLRLAAVAPRPHPEP